MWEKWGRRKDKTIKDFVLNSRKSMNTDENGNISILKSYVSNVGIVFKIFL